MPDLIQGSPPALPGSCFLCSSGTRKRYFDWNISFEFHGAVYICDECVIDCAHKLGMADEEKVTSLTLDVTSLEEEKASLLRAIEELKEVINGVDLIRNYLPNGNSLPLDVLHEGEAVSASNAGSDKGKT